MIFRISLQGLQVAARILSIGATIRPAALLVVTMLVVGRVLQADVI